MRETIDVSEINHAGYRAYVTGRVEANKAMMALLAGSRLAAHSLQLHAGSPHPLPGLFPAVNDIDRFNLLPDPAARLLLDADAHLSAVAIPYALAVYEAYVKDAISLLSRDGIVVATDRNALNAGRMHRTFYDAAATEQLADTVALFHLLRTVRNAQIHHAGSVTDEVRQTFDSLTPSQRQRWEQLTMSDAEVMFDGAKLRFSLGHLIAAFAVTKEAARRINAALAMKISRETWAGLAVEDYAADAEHPKNSRQWKRGLIGFARFHYLGNLALTDAELENAARTSTLWSAPTW